MKHLVTLAVVAVLCVPAAALAADPTPSPSSLAKQQCKAQRASMDAATFKAAYGTNKTKSNAYGKCISKAAQLAKAELANAAKSCKAERTSDPNAFASKYGTAGDQADSSSSKSKGNGKNDSKTTNASQGNGNAFGKCVSQAVKTASADHTDAVVSAAKQCKADRKADKETFAKTYASFGKCVSQKSKQS